MKVPFSTTYVLFFLYFIFTFCEAKIKIPDNVKIPALLAFGDSICDSGNNNNIRTMIKCNFPPYGKDFKGGVPTGRFCNGKTSTDFMAEEFGIKEYVPAYSDPHLKPSDLITGVSFGSGGTGYDPQTSQLQSVLTMSDEINMFKEYIGKLKALVGEERTKFIIENSIYIITCGSNDLANTYFTIGLRKLQYNIDAYTTFLVQKATEFVTELHKLGAKRLSVYGVPAIGCLPAERFLTGGLSRDCNENYNKGAQIYNSKLTTALNALRNRLNDPKARISYADGYTPMLEIIENPKKYGFTNVIEGCCGTGTIETTLLCNKLGDICSNDSSYLFWDSFHPTERGYRVIVDIINKAGTSNLF